MSGTRALKSRWADAPLPNYAVSVPAQEPPVPASSVEARGPAVSVRAALAADDERLRKALEKNMAYIKRKREDAACIVHDDCFAQEGTDCKRTRAAAAALSSTGCMPRAGVGSRSQRSRQHARRRAGAVPHVNTSMYVSGLPVPALQAADTDVAPDSKGGGSTGAQAALEEMFAAYGAVRRVKVYRCSDGVTPKGDALVVFKLEQSVHIAISALRGKVMAPPWARGIAFSLHASRARFELRDKITAGNNNLHDSHGAAVTDDTATSATTTAADAGDAAAIYDVAKASQPANFVLPAASAVAETTSDQDKLDAFLSSF